MRTMAVAAAAMLLLLVSLAAAAATTNTSDSTQKEIRSEEETRRLFTEWKANRGKTYSSINVEERAYATFKRRLHVAARHNDHYPDWAYPELARSRYRSEEETRRIFEEWTAERGDTYGSLYVERLAYDRFRHGLRRVDRYWHDAGYPRWSWDTLGRSEEETRQIFVLWKAKHGKIYSSLAHEEHRYAIFKDALHEVDRHNAGYPFGLHAAHVGIDYFTDLTHEEYKAICSTGTGRR